MKRSVPHIKKIFPINIVKPNIVKPKPPIKTPQNMSFILPEYQEYSEYSFTAVSGYWIVNNKHKDNDFLKWFQNTLSLNCPYVFFGNEQSINMVKSFRDNLPTFYIKLEIEDFYTYKYKDLIQTHPIHCPSKELNMIWNEKIYLIQRASELNPFDTEHFSWIDAGICTFRNQKPSNCVFPNFVKFKSLPKDKIICCPTDSPKFDINLSISQEYYHYISGNYIIPKSILPNIIELYSVYLDKYMKKIDWKYTDQVIWTKVYTNYKSLFHIIGKKYGDIWKILI